MRKTTAFLTILATSLISYGALAQDEAAPPPAAAPEAAPPAAAAPEAAPAPAPAPAAAPAAGGDYVSRGLTLSAGTFQVTLPVVIGLDKGAAFKKIQIPLDLRYGVTNELEVFATHSFIGTSPVFSGGGVCIGDKNPYCPKVYNNVAVGGQYSLLKQPGLELSGLLAVDIRAFSPDLLLDIDVGVGFKYSASPIAVKVTPVIGIGANKRSTGNIKQFISVPVQVAFQATPELALFVDTGIFGMSDHFSDNYIVPAGLGASFAVQKGLDVGAEFMFTGLVTGVKGDKAMDARSAMVFAAYRTN